MPRGKNPVNTDCKYIFCTLFVEHTRLQSQSYPPVEIISSTITTDAMSTQLFGSHLYLTPLMRFFSR